VLPGQMTSGSIMPEIEPECIRLFLQTNLLQ
jgi:hypothetical protein